MQIIRDFFLQKVHFGTFARYFWGIFMPLLPYLTGSSVTGQPVSVDT